MRLHRGTVTRAAGTGLFVKLPGAFGSAEIGPLEHLAGRIANHVFTDNDTGLESGGNSTETLIHQQRINAGDRVLVAELAEDDYIVLGRIVTGVPV